MIIGREYAVALDAQTYTATDGNVDIFSIVPAADKPLCIEAFYLSNVGGTADAGDAQEELLRITFKRMTGTVTITGGTTISTIPPFALNDGTASFTAKSYHATVATTTGTTHLMHADGWNVRIPYVWMPPPEHRISVGVSSAAFVVRCESTPADDLTISATLIVSELL